MSRLSMPLTVIFTRAALYDGCGPLPKKNWTPLIKTRKASLKHSVMCLLTETPSRLTQ